MRIGRVFFNISLVVCLFFGGIAWAQEDLSRSDIRKVMQDILSKHVSHDQMTPEIMKHSIEVYFDQFDPDRIYLLESEVQPFKNLSDSQLDFYVQEYRNDRYPLHEQANQTIQRAIERARRVRANQLAQPDKIFHESLTFELGPEPTTYAQTTEELSERMKNDLLRFIADERRLYSDSIVKQQMGQTLALYDRVSREFEGPYLFQERDGKAMSAQDKEHYQSLNILKAFARSLDTYTTFLDDREAYDMRLRLEKSYEGVGIILGKEGSRFFIEKILPRSPASESGLIKVDDVVVKVNGIPTAGKSMDEVIELLRGEAGTKLTLEVERPLVEGHNLYKKPLTVTLERKQVAVLDDRVQASYVKVDGGIIGIIMIPSFYQGQGGISTENDVRKALYKLQALGDMKGLILDLRDNTGGFLNQAVKVAGLFITSGVIVVSKYHDGDTRFYRDMDGKVFYRGPLVVLTSRGTASAAEIVAQALQDYGVGVVVGDDQTYGKGTIQTQTVTDAGTHPYFKVTVGEYYTVSGRTPEQRGVVPDIIVPGKYHSLPLKKKDEAIPASIAPAYRDDLADVDADLKPWFVKYYLPTLQSREKAWREMVPTLQKKSGQRMSHSDRYQELVQGKNLSYDSLFDEKSSRNQEIDTLQLKEGVYVIKDMIALETIRHTQNPR